MTPANALLGLALLVEDGARDSAGERYMSGCQEAVHYLTETNHHGDRCIRIERCHQLTVAELRADHGDKPLAHAAIRSVMPMCGRGSTRKAAPDR
jgi:hypothetical protein